MVDKTIHVTLSLTDEMTPALQSLSRHLEGFKDKFQGLGGNQQQTDFKRILERIEKLGAKDAGEHFSSLAHRLVRSLGEAGKGLEAITKNLGIFKGSFAGAAGSVESMAASVGELTGVAGAFGFAVYEGINQLDKWAEHYSAIHVKMAEFRESLGATNDKSIDSWRRLGQALGKSTDESDESLTKIVGLLDDARKGYDSNLAHIAQKHPGMMQEFENWYKQIAVEGKQPIEVLQSFMEFVHRQTPEFQRQFSEEIGVSIDYLGKRADAAAKKMVPVWEPPDAAFKKLEEEKDRLAEHSDRWKQIWDDFSRWVEFKLELFVIPGLDKAMSVVDAVFGLDPESKEAHDERIRSRFRPSAPVGPPPAAPQRPYHIQKFGDDGDGTSGNASIDLREISTGSREGNTYLREIRDIMVWLKQQQQGAGKLSGPDVGDLLPGGSKGGGGRSGGGGATGDVGDQSTGGPAQLSDQKGTPIDAETMKRVEELGKAGDVNGLQQLFSAKGYHMSGAVCGEIASRYVRSAGFQPPKSGAIATSWHNWGEAMKPEDINAPGHPFGSMVGTYWHGRYAGREGQLLRPGEIGGHVMNIIPGTYDAKSGTALMIDQAGRPKRRSLSDLDERFAGSSAVAAAEARRHGSTAPAPPAPPASTASTPQPSPPPSSGRRAAFIPGGPQGIMSASSHFEDDPDFDNKPFSTGPGWEWMRRSKNILDRRKQGMLAVALDTIAKPITDIALLPKFIRDYTYHGQNDDALSKALGADSISSFNKRWEGRRFDPQTGELTNPIDVIDRDENINRSQAERSNAEMDRSKIDQSLSEQGKDSSRINNAKLSINVSGAPKGTRINATGDGMFQNVALQRSYHGAINVALESTLKHTTTEAA